MVISLKVYDLLIMIGLNNVSCCQHIVNPFMTSPRNTWATVVVKLGLLKN